MNTAVINTLFISLTVSLTLMSAIHVQPSQAKEPGTMSTGQQSILTVQQKYIAAIAAQGAEGNIPGLNSAIQRGLDAGLTINDCREILVQLYAYAGFPRSLNALTELMNVINTRKANGINDAEGKLPGPLPRPEEMLKIGTQNQTSLVGQPVKGQLFEFAPAADEYLKTHLFGDIFSRDNLDWKSRELATVGALAAMTGVESQLKAHITMSMNVGITSSQLRELVRFFGESDEPAAAARLKNALDTLQND